MSAAQAVPRLYWVPAVGIVPSVHKYRQDTGLDSVPLPPMSDVTSYVPALGGEMAAAAPGQARGEEMAAELVAAMGHTSLNSRQ